MGREWSTIGDVVRAGSVMPRRGTTRDGGIAGYDDARAEIYTSYSDSDLDHAKPISTRQYARLVEEWVTRGKKLVVLVGQRKAIAMAVRNGGQRRRWSKLQEWLSL